MAHVSPCAVQRTARGPTARYGSGVHRENCGRGPTRSAGESIRAPLWIHGYASVTSPSGNPAPTNSLLWGRSDSSRRPLRSHRTSFIETGSLCAAQSLRPTPHSHHGLVAGTYGLSPPHLSAARLACYGSEFRTGLGKEKSGLAVRSFAWATSFWSVAPLRSQKHLQTSSIFTPTHSKSSSQRIQAVPAALIKP